MQEIVKLWMYECVNVWLCECVNVWIYGSIGSIVLWKFWGCPTHGQSIEASLEGEDENVPAGAEARDGPACEEQAQEPEEGPDGVTLQ